MNRVFVAIAHAERRQILTLLKRHGELPAGEISAHFAFAKPTLSHHLKLLTDAGLLDRERRGQFIYYRINLSVFEEAGAAILELFAVGKPARPAPRNGNPGEPRR